MIGRLGAMNVGCGGPMPRGRKTMAAGVVAISLSGLSWTLSGCCQHSYEDDAVKVAPRSHKRSYELNWYAPIGSSSDVTVASMQVTGEVDMVRMDGSSDYTVEGTRLSDYTEFDLCAGRYDFHYHMPWRNESVDGEINLHCPDDDARTFLRHTPLVFHPGGDLNSVISEDDLMQASSGELVTKVIFVADLKAVEDRISNIDRELRHVDVQEADYSTQKRYWSAKRDQRRQNAMVPGDLVWGEDVPGMDLAFYQLLLGSEKYHWARYTEADRNARHYEDRIADLDLPVERLREERSALRSILGSVRVINRSHDLMMATPSMTQRYHDPVSDIERPRMTLAVSSCPLASATELVKRIEDVGDVVCVIRFGPRGLERME